MKKILLAVLCLCAGTVVAQDLYPELAGLGGRTRSVDTKKTVTSKPEVGGINLSDNQGTVQPNAAPSVDQFIENDMDSSEADLPEIGVELRAEERDFSAEELASLTAETTETNEDVDLFAAPVEAAPTEETTEEEEEEEEDEKDQKITIYMQDAESTMTPNRDFSYCFGIFKILNTLKKPVLALDFVLNYGGLTSNYSVRNLMPNEEKAGTVTLVGKSCAHILDMPEMTIKTCQVEDMEPAKCKKKVVFLPLRGE